MAVAPPSFDGGRAARPSPLPQPGPSPLSEIAGGVAALGQAGLRHELQGREDALRVQQATDQARGIEDEQYVRVAGAKQSALLAESQGQLLSDLRALRTAEGTTPDNYAELAGKRIDQFRTGFMDGLDERLQPMFMDNVARIGEDAQLGAQTWAAEQQAVAGTIASATLSAQLGTNLRNATIDGTATSEALTTAVQQWRDHVAHMPLPPAAREQELQRGLREINAGPMRGLIASRPDLAMQALDQGWGAGLFEDDDLARFRAQAAAAQAHIETQARAEQERATGESRARADVLIGQVNDGVALDEAGRTFLESELARTAGSRDPADIRQHDQVQEALDRNVVTSQFDTATQGQRRAAIGQIESTANWRSNPQLVRRHSALETLINRDATEATDNQLGQYVRRSGRQLPPLNFTDFAAMDQRFGIAEAAARENRRPPQYLTKPEADDLRDQWNRGTPADRSAMIAQVAQYGYSRAGLLMRQILPAAQENADSAALIRVATMRDRRAGFGIVNETLNGWALPANTHTENAATMQSDLQAAYGPVLSAMGGDQQAGTLNMARGIYRHRAAQAGETRYNRDLWLESYQAALGRSGNTGGIATWSVPVTLPGIGPRRLGSGQPYVLPRGMAAHDVEYVISRATLAEYRSASGGDTPAWSGAVPLAEGNIATLTPVLIEDNNRAAGYQFRGNNGFLQSTAHPGQNFTIDIRALNRLVHQRTRGR